MAGLGSPGTDVAGSGSAVSSQSMAGSSVARSMRFKSLPQAVDFRLSQLTRVWALLLTIAIPLSGFVLWRIHWADRLLKGTLSFVRFDAVSAPLRPGLGGMAGLAAFFLLFALLRSVDGILHGPRKTIPRAGGLPDSFLGDAAAAPSSSGIVKVSDLLVQTENPAPVYGAGGSPPAPAPASLGPSIAKSKAVYTAALMAIESRSLQSPAPPGTLRRSSDYDGPRRRSTDGQPHLAYEGPYRRSSDSAAGRANGPPNERRSEAEAASTNRSEASSASPLPKPDNESGSAA